MALPDDLQLRRRLPARHPHHSGDPRSLVGDRGATGLNARRDPAWESLWDSVGANESGRESPAAPGAPAGEVSASPEPASPTPDGRRTPAGDPRRTPAAAEGRHFVVRTDGAARGNPGPASLGAVLIDASLPGARRPDAVPVASISEYLGTQTNNVAEYTGLVRALALAEELGATQVDLLLDSMLIVEQLQGHWRVKDAKLIPLHRQARERLGRLARWTVAHVPRSQNKAADALCNEAIDRALAGGPRIVVRRPE